MFVTVLSPQLSTIRHLSHFLCFDWIETLSICRLCTGMSCTGTGCPGSTWRWLERLKHIGWLCRSIFRSKLKPELVSCGCQISRIGGLCKLPYRIFTFQTLHFQIILRMDVALEQIVWDWRWWLYRIGCWHRVCSPWKIKWLGHLAGSRKLMTCR